MTAQLQEWAVWLSLLIATMGTYVCRAVGVKLSGHIDQNSEVFRWLSAVTYAMVAALTVRMILLPLGLLASVPLALRVLICGLSVAVMVSHPQRRLVPALLTGTVLMMTYGVFRASL